MPADKLHHDYAPNSSAGFYGKASHHPGLSGPLQPRLGSLRLVAFLKAKIAFEMEEGPQVEEGTSSQKQHTDNCDKPPFSVHTAMLTTADVTWRNLPFIVFMMTVNCNILTTA